MNLKVVDIIEDLDRDLHRDMEAFIHDLHAGSANLIDTQPGTTFRNNIFVSRSGRMVFKAYSLRERKLIERLRARWKVPSRKFGHRFGWGEWLNARQAGAKGISIAAPMAYLENSSVLSCSLQVVAFEKLNNHRTMLDSMINGEAVPGLLDRIEGAIWTLASSGVFHADLNCRNILIPEHPSASSRIIDWEYACFDRQDIGGLYRHYLGYLYFGGVRKFMAEGDYDRWAQDRICARLASLNDKALPSSPATHYDDAKKNLYPRDLRYTMFI